MLSKKFRLKDRGDFRRIYQRGKSIACPYFVVYAKRSPSAARKAARIGFSASKKLGNAVTRNRQRRRLSELCRRNFALFGSQNDYIFIIRNAMKHADNARLESSLFFCMNRLSEQQAAKAQAHAEAVQ